MSFVSIFYNFIICGFLVPLFLLMLVGRPRFFIRILQSLVLFKVPSTSLPLIGLITGVSGLSALYSFFKYIQKRNKYNSLLLDLVNGAIKTEYESVYLDKKQMKATLFERNSLIYFCGFLLAIAIFKMAYVYEKSFELEAKEELNENNQNKPADLKKQE